MRLLKILVLILSAGPDIVESSDMPKPGQEIILPAGMR